MLWSLGRGDQQIAGVLFCWLRQVENCSISLYQHTDNWVVSCPLQGVGAPGFCWVPVSLGEKSILCEVADLWVMLCINTLNKGSSAEPLQYHSKESGSCSKHCILVTALWLLSTMADLQFCLQVHWATWRGRHAVVGNVTSLSIFLKLRNPFDLSENKIALTQNSQRGQSKMSV